MTSFIRIPNWETFQHYKDRNPPWIKLHKELLTSETWVSSSNDDRVLAIAIMLLAGECNNKIPANPRYIQRRAYLEKEPDLSGLVALKFIEIIEENDVASKPLAIRTTETETQVREQKEDSVANATGAVAPLPAIDLKSSVFNSGAALMVRLGMKNDPSARSLLGRLRNQYGDAPVIDALSALEAEKPSDPAPFLIKTLESRYGGKNKLRGSRPDPSLDFYRQAQAECGDEADYRGTGVALPPPRPN